MSDNSNSGSSINRTINTPKGKMKIRQANNGLAPENGGGVQLQNRLNADEWPAWQNHGQNFKQPALKKDPKTELKEIREKVKVMETELAELIDRMDRIESEIKD